MGAYIKTAIVLILGLAYLLNSPILKSFFPEAGIDWNQYAEYVSARFKVYECMFFLFFALVYLQAQGMVKSIAVWFLIMAAGSVVDKVFFNFYSYLHSDYILGAVALIISRRVYVRENR